MPQLELNTLIFVYLCNPRKRLGNQYMKYVTWATRNIRLQYYICIFSMVTFQDCVLKHSDYCCVISFFVASPSAQLESSAYNLGKLYISKSLFWLHTQPWKDCRGRSGLRLVSVDQEPPHLDVFRNGATTVTFPPCASSHSWTRDKDRNMLPGLRRQRTGLFLSRLFIWKNTFHFI